MLLAVVPQVPENHPNMEAILGELDMESVEFSVSADVKMCKLPQLNINHTRCVQKQYPFCCIKNMTKIPLILIAYSFKKHLLIFPVNCLVGKASGQPKFGCPFCDTGSPYNLEDYELYSLGDLEDWHDVGSNIIWYRK